LLTHLLRQVGNEKKLLRIFLAKAFMSPWTTCG
jgi:hypothetical protein